MAEPEYEDLNQLRKELAGKKDEHISNEQLAALVKGLSAQIEQLTEVFRMALRQMGSEDESQKRISGQLDTLIKNDQDLARGLLLVLEIEKERKEMGLDPLQPRRSFSRRRATRPIIRPEMSMPPEPPTPPAPENGSSADVEFPRSAQPGSPPQ